MTLLLQRFKDEAGAQRRQAKILHIYFYARISRVPVRRWAAALALGECIKTAALVSLGFVYARAVQQASQTAQIVLWCVTAAALAIGLVWFSRKNRSKNNF